MLEKHFDTTAYFVNPRAKHCKGSCDFLVKEANVIPDSVQFFEQLQPKPNHLYTLVIGMTDSYYYGANKNGDFFRGVDLQKYYTKFENAGVFWNHDNKDMSKSAGKVIKAFYNTQMARVELIIEVPIENARYIPNYIEEGKPIAVSMGLRTPYEVCSICGHVTRGSYENRCSHLKFEMNKVYPDGRKVYAICGTPYELFDISYVFRPADRVAYALLTKTNK
jgi:hypothetical protein